MSKLLLETVGGGYIHLSKVEGLPKGQFLITEANPYPICRHDELNRTLNETIEREGDLIISGKIQNAGDLNQNGRVYPRHILEREIKRYQKIIDSRNAVGECVTEETEIFTIEGWKSIKDVQEGELIATLNVFPFIYNDNIPGTIEFQNVSHKIEKDYTGTLYRIHGKEFDMKVTPNHKIVFAYPYVCHSEEPNTFCLGMTCAEDFVSKLNKQKDKLPGLMKLIDVEDVKISEEQYSGKVYCVTVPNGTWLMRYNGKIIWTGNCDHPSERIIIDHERLSHRITKIWWQGNDVYANIKILTETPFGAIVAARWRDGQPIGFSSRGVGSVSEKGGKAIVNEDFQLICWDIVHDPSTLNAFATKTVSEAKVSSRTTVDSLIERILNSRLK